MQWTNNPYVDIGLSAILAFCDKDEPEELTEADLNTVANWIAENYPRNPLKSFLTIVFPNSPFTNATTKDDKRRTQIQNLLFSYREIADDSSERCVLTGDKVTSRQLAEDHPIGRAYRQHVPLIMGEGHINFFPQGDSGLPIAGWALLCIQAFPLGCAKVGSRLLAVHASNPRMTQLFASHFLEENLKRIDLAQKAQSEGMPASSFTFGTAIANVLTEIFTKSSFYQDESGLPSLTAYHFTNYGSNPAVSIYHLPLGVMRFLRRANGGSYQALWGKVVQGAWQSDEPKVPKTKKNAAPAEASSAKPDKPRKNYLYEDLLKLPDNAAHFLRVYFLRKAARYARQNDQDPRGEYSTAKQANLVSWDLTQLFLTEVMNMDKTRIEQIRQFGDTLAEYISTQNDKNLFQSFYAEMDYLRFRNDLIRKSTKWSQKGNPPLLSFDQYVDIFEPGERFSKYEWTLARDLVLIRLIERLHSMGWLGALPNDPLLRDLVKDENQLDLVNESKEIFFDETN